MKPLLLRLGPWVVLALAAAVAFGLWGAVVGACLLAVTEVLQFLRERQLQAGRLDVLEAKVKELATPERVQATHELLEQMKRVTGMRRG